MNLGFHDVQTHGLDELVAVFTELHRHYVGDAAPPPQAVRDNLARALGQGGADVRVAVARDDGPAGPIAGVATVARLIPAPGAQGQLFMKDLFVRAPWRGHGVGEALMAFLARHALDQGCVRLDWTTETGNPGALAFYDRLGAMRVTEKVYFRFTGDALVALAQRAPVPVPAVDTPPPLHAEAMPPLLQALRALHRVLDAVGRLPAAQADAALQARLADDMMNLAQQVETACFMTLRTAFPLAGRPLPAFGDEPRTADGLRQRVTRAEALLRALPPADFATPPRRVQERAGQADLDLPPPEFLRRFALPNVAFHVSMAYAIARAQGARLGKGDFDGLHTYPI